MVFQSPTRLNVETQIPKNFWDKYQSFPIDIEIGCGVGFHPIRYSLTNPDRILIAIERTKLKFAKFQTRYQNHREPQNLFPIHADATHWIFRHVPDFRVDRIFILYPNPYPKLRQKNQRFAYSTFLPELIKKLKVGGTLELATNLYYYAEEMKTELTETWGLRLLKSTVIDPETKPRSHFEKKYLERGDNCFDLVFQKTE